LVKKQGMTLVIHVDQHFKPILTAGNIGALRRISTAC
jgi:hypothetical protein